MRLCRATVVWLVVVGALALFGGSSALASGPSAGDQQYVDPLGGSTTPSSQSPPPSSSSSPSASATPTITTASSTVAANSTTTTSTGSTTASTTASSAATLPRTGYDGWLAAVIGVGLMGAGLAIRRQAFSR